MGHPSHRADVRTRLLDVAEDLFAKHGFTATSTRMIASAAGMNLGNLHYYFKRKDALYEEVFLRRGRSMVDERMKLLGKASKKYGSERIPVREVIRCFVRPILALAQKSNTAAYVQLHCRLPSEPRELALSVRAKVYNESTRAFVSAFRSALPDLPEDVLFWRIHFMIGAINYTLAKSGRLEFLSDGRCTTTDIDAALTQILPFLEAGLVSAAPNTIPATFGSSVGADE